MKKLLPFLWMFQKDEPRIKNATSGEDIATESVNEETSTSIIETTYEKIRDNKKCQ